MTGLLSHCKVLDCSDNRGTACSTFLASLGAEVIRVENNLNTLDHTEITDRRGKKSITLNLQHDKGIELFNRLITQVDFLLETFTPGLLAQRGIAYEDLVKINPRLIHISITPFGQNGPYRHYTGSELVASAMGGTLATCGYPDDKPVLEALDACCFHANAAAAMGAMLAHRERGVSGQGQHVDCSIQEVAASRNTNNLLCWQFDRRTLARAGDKVQFGAATVRVVWELRDGYCFHSLMTGKFGAPANAALSAWMTDDGCINPMAEVDWDKYDRSALPAEVRLEWEAAMSNFFKTKTKLDIATEGYRRGIRATVANTPNDVLHDEHLAAREFLQPLDVDDSSQVGNDRSTQDKKVLAPDYFVRLSNTDYRIGKQVPSAGQDNPVIYRELLGLDEQEIVQLTASGVLS